MPREFLVETVRYFVRPVSTRLPELLRSSKRRTPYEWPIFRRVRHPRRPESGIPAPRRYSKRPRRQPDQNFVFPALLLAPLPLAPFQPSRRGSLGLRQRRRAEQNSRGTFRAHRKLHRVSPGRVADARAQQSVGNPELACRCRGRSVARSPRCISSLPQCAPRRRQPRAGPRSRPRTRAPGTTEVGTKTRLSPS